MLAVCDVGEIDQNWLKINSGCAHKDMCHGYPEDTWTLLQTKTKPLVFCLLWKREPLQSTIKVWVSEDSICKH